jgi:hypothetical protein
MLHYSMGLFTLSAREFLITGEKKGEKPVKRDPVLADRLYGALHGTARLKERGAGYAVRLRCLAFNITVKKGGKEPVRACALRKSVINERKGKQRLRERGTLR